MKTETQKTEEKSFTVNEIGTILERMEGNMQLMAENIVSIDHRLVRVEQKVDRLQDDMVEVKFDLKCKVSQEDLEKLEKRVTKLERHAFSH